MEKEVLKTVIDKYSYSENEQNALIYALDAMILVYGEDKLSNLIKLLEDVPIHFLPKIEDGMDDQIRDEECAGINSHIEEVTEIDPYGKKTCPGSWLGTQTIFDENMNPIGQKKWLGVKDMKGSYNEQGYRDLFGTSVNIPCLIHELNHAYAMQNPVYNVTGNLITEKKGMFVTQSSFTKVGDKFILKDESSEDILLEEAINEYITQEMLTKKMGCNDYKEVESKLRDINHVTSSYSAILMSVADWLTKLLKERLTDYRINNDMSVIEEFNNHVMETETGKIYLEGKNPYEELSRLTKSSFLLTCECYRHPIEEYKRMQGEIVGELYAPLYALAEYYGKMSIADYEALRELKGLKKVESR